MKLEKAFSLDLDRTITAADADYHYRQGAIHSSKSFKCPDLRCNARVTCANLDKPKVERKRDPYFIVVSNHSDICTISQDIRVLKGKKAVYGDGYSDSDEYIENSFKLNLRSLDNTRVENGNVADDDPQSNGVHRQNRKSETKKRYKQQRSKTVSSLVTAYLNNEDIEVQLTESSFIHINELFIKIEGQQISDLNTDMRIYYGKAWINKSPKDNGFIVRFANILQHNELSVRPSFFIHDELIKKSGYKKFQQATLNALVTNKPIDIYILSNNGPYFDKSGNYIKFNLGGLEYLEYRSD